MVGMSVVVRMAGRKLSASSRPFVAAWRKFSRIWGFLDGDG